MVGEIVQGLAGIAQGAIDARTARMNTNRTIRANKELAEYQYSKDVEMWNRQNEYNNPASQMTRLKEAGLNPNMVYGSGTVAGNTSATMPKYQAPRVDYNYKPVIQDLPGVISQYQDFMIRQAEINNAHKRGKLLDAQEKLAQENIMMTGTKRYYHEPIWRSQGDYWQGRGQKEKNEADYLWNDPSIDPGLYKTKGFERMNYQTEYLAGRNLLQEGALAKQASEISLLDRKTEYQEKVNYLYNILQLGKLGVDVFGEITKLFSRGLIGGRKSFAPGGVPYPKPGIKNYGNYPGAGMR